jgi:hypothetical protein
VVTEEVKIAQGSTRSRHDLLELLLLVSEAAFLLTVTLVTRVILVDVVVLVGEVELLPLGQSAMKWVTFSRQSKLY